jgi:hypothetical protein
VTEPKAPAVLAGLKDFQRSTVEYVYERLFAPGASGRFLVADEVGLGKTMIAKGIVAKTIDRHRGTVDRIDIVYVCSNGDIARQNIDRLRVGDEQQVTLATRLTLLPRELPRLRATTSGVNFVSLTPGTSFDVSGGLGQAPERALLYTFLREAWQLGAEKSAVNVFQGGVGYERFRELVSRQMTIAPDPELCHEFAAALQAHDESARSAGEPGLRTRFDRLAAAYVRGDSNPRDAEIPRERARFVGTLRAKLAACCIGALEPDLVILDEFQRFTGLLDGEDEAGRLARELFAYQDVRLLLLSATPYRMYSTADDDRDDHYVDFLRTLRFLERSNAEDRSFERSVAAYRSGLIGLGDGSDPAGVEAARMALEQRLRQVMVRTERLASAENRCDMLRVVAGNTADVRPEDLLHFLSVQKIAKQLGAGDALELWKSAPYILNFAESNYALRRKLDEALEHADSRQRILRLLETAPNAHLPLRQVHSGAPIESPNPRMRALLQDAIDSGAWQLLWIPPSLPYYRLAGVFASLGAAACTKRLVFSAWRMVPRAIAALVSHEAERRMTSDGDSAPGEAGAQAPRRGLLRFGVSDGRLTGMPVLALLYPSLYLAQACDPAVLLGERARERAAGADDFTPNHVELEEVLEIAQARVEITLRRIGATRGDGAVDERWYWAAPLLLDRLLNEQATVDWFQQPDLPAEWSGAAECEPDGTAAHSEDDPVANEALEEGQEADGWRLHVEQASSLARDPIEGLGSHPLGRMPDDLAEVLAELAVAGPAVTMFRALSRLVGREEDADLEAARVLRNGAARTAWSFRSLFNQPLVMSLLRQGKQGTSPLPYWRKVLRYCADGCLAAVLDEYVHVLQDRPGLKRPGVTLQDSVEEIANEIRDAAEIRTSHVGIHYYEPSSSGGSVSRETKSIKTHFALRFADEAAERDQGPIRADQIRKAFNSPFWPFVLATTSVGQEGLDFHTYCHAVVHWNLPSNPVDLEQREGRVHRYKGHAVRRNVARRHGWEALREAGHDPWEALFCLARTAASAAGESEIVPYWVYPLEGGAQIERHVPVFPMSREVSRMHALSKSLAVYRMVFGQPRQDDLLRYLLAHLDQNQIAEALQAARIDLSPPRPTGAI